MNRSMLTRFLSDLPEISRIGELTPEQTEKIRRHYSAQLSGAGSPLPVILTILGSLLIGLGVILLFAHNWSYFSPMAKTGIAAVPFLAASLFAGSGLYKGKDSAQFREPAALLMFLSFGAAVGLVNQAWQTGGSAEAFLTLLCAAAVPLIYIFRSYSAAVLSVIFLIWLQWTSRNFFWGDESFSLHYWIFIPFLLPFLIQKFKESRSEAPYLLLLWLIVISLYSAVMTSLPFDFSNEIIIPILVTVSILLLAADAVFFASEKSGWSAPFRTGSKIVLLFFYIMFSYSGMLSNFGSSLISDESAVMLLLLALFAGSITIAVVKRQYEPIPFMIPAGIILAGASVNELSFIGMILLNASLLALGIWTMKSGADDLILRRVNFGFIMVASVIILRFFDSDLSFTLRGILFILLGIGFLTTNLKISSRRKQHA